MRLREWRTATAESTARGQKPHKTDRVVTIDPSLKEDVRDMLAFVPTRMYRVSRMPIDGEFGSVGNCSIVVSDAGGAIRNMRALLAVVWGRS